MEKIISPFGTQKPPKTISCWLTEADRKYIELKESKLELPSNFDFKVTHKDAQMFSFLIKQEILDKLKGLGPHD